MTTPAELYGRGIRDKLKNYFAAWLPNVKMRLGDFGTLDGDLFTRIGTLSDLGISFKERPDPDSAPIDYVSESGVSIFVKAAGETSAALSNVPEGRAGIGVEFSRQGAFILKAPASYSPSIESPLKLETQLLKALKGGVWERNWVVVVRVVNTPTATILISNTSHSKIEWAIEGEVSAGQIDLANMGAHFGFRAQTGDILNLPGAKNLTPVFQLGRLKRRLLGTSFSIRAVRVLHADAAAAKPGPSQEDPAAEGDLYFDLVDDADVVS